MSDEQIAIIHEALKFHGLKPGELRQARLEHEEAVKSEGKPSGEAAEQK